MEKINLLLRDIYVKKDTSLPSDASLRTLLRLMSRNDKGVVVVVRDDRPVGILTERDVVRLLHVGADLDEGAERFAMAPLITASANRTISFALTLMIENDIRRLVIVDDDYRFLGVVTQKDLLHHLEEDFYRASLKVKHILDRMKELVAVEKYTSISEVLHRMVRHNISGIPILEDRTAVGVITEKDILQLSDQSISLLSPVCDHMSSPVVTVTLETQLTDIVKTMNTKNIRRVVVVDTEGKSAGVLTHRDLVRNLEGDYNEFLERKLKYSRDLLNLLPEMMFELIDMGSEQVVVWGNEKVLARFGAKVLDRPVTELVPPLRWGDIYSTLRRHGKIEGLKFKRDEHVYELSGFYLPFEKASEKGRIQLILMDITEEVMQATTDDLTHLYNRRHLNETLTKEIERSRRKERSLTVVMADVDDFKKINDSYGHSCGDTVLKSIATFLIGGLRQYDIVGRYGGEEFLIIMPETDKETAHGVVNRIRATIENSRVDVGAGRSLSVTVSFGLAEYREDGLSPDDLLVKADERLYRAKAGQKNRVVSS